MKTCPFGRFCWGRALFNFQRQCRQPFWSFQQILGFGKTFQRPLSTILSDFWGFRKFCWQPFSIFQRISRFWETFQRFVLLCPKGLVPSKTVWMDRSSFLQKMLLMNRTPCMLQNQWRACTLHPVHDLQTSSRSLHYCHTFIIGIDGALQRG